MTSPHQLQFIDFLVHSGVLTFGEFTLKSGRIAPYYINTGNLDDGEKIAKLGEFYATHLIKSGLSATSIIFGPAYKGIPLAVATAVALAKNHGINAGFSFDRKEIKDHGDGGFIVGHKIKAGDKLVIVEDVVTAGTTFQKIVPMLRALDSVEILGAVVAVDRQERGTSNISAVQEIESTLKVPVFPVVTMTHVIEYLKVSNGSGYQIPPPVLDKISSYRAQYGI